MNKIPPLIQFVNGLSKFRSQEEEPMCVKDQQKQSKVPKLVIVLNNGNFNADQINLDLFHK